MAKRNNRNWLIRFMKKHRLTRAALAQMVCVNVSTVDRWLVPEDMSSHRHMPDMAVRLLEYQEKTFQ